MPDEAIIDTNILAYAYDDSEPEKRKKCFKLVKEIFEGKREGCATNQILAELFFTLTKNFRKPLNIEEARVIINSIQISSNWKKINYDGKTVEKAIKIVETCNVPFWDALIAATMLENNVFSVYTENINDFKKIPGLKIKNPFE